jgi:hypothetical protein
VTPISEFSRPPAGMQTRLSRRVLRFMASVSRPRANRAVRAADSARTASLHQYPVQSNRPRYPLVRKAILHLDGAGSHVAFSESEQSRNGAGEMVPLSAARIKDLKPGDFVVIKCGEHARAEVRVRLRRIKISSNRGPRRYLLCRESVPRHPAVPKTLWVRKAAPAAAVPAGDCHSMPMRHHLRVERLGGAARVTRLYQPVQRSRAQQIRPMKKPPPAVEDGGCGVPLGGPTIRARTAAAYHGGNASPRALLPTTDR